MRLTYSRGRLSMRAVVLAILLGSLTSCATNLSIDPVGIDADDSPTDDDVPGGGGADGDDDTPDDVIVDDDTPTGPLSCGDGVLDDEEACDDGNTAAGDGCDEDCLAVDEGYACLEAGEPCIRAEVCGDGIKSRLEGCDDGNLTPADGCSSSCAPEPGFKCTKPNEPCVFIVECGDGKISVGFEDCDDNNSRSGDGCNAECKLEAGWVCPVPGGRCAAAECGDGLVAGNEQCEDGNLEPGDGCDESCKIEDGYVCEDVGMPCRVAICGDEVAEGGEPCDDGNNTTTGDGCSPGCILEPNCEGVDGCTSSCGDGMVLTGDAEECDDGNTADGDGCSASCEIEKGWDCTLVDTNLGTSLELPIIYRDFKAFESGGHVAFQWTGDDPIDLTPKEDVWVRTQLGTAADTLPDGTSLKGKPVFKWYVKCDHDSCDNLTPETGQSRPAGTLNANTCNAVKGAATGTRYINVNGRNSLYCGYGAKDFLTFSQWYVDTEDVNLPVISTLTLSLAPDATPNAYEGYRYSSEGFFPIDGLGFGNGGNTNNFHFTSELRYWFEYDPAANATLEFFGDDDVWVFVNGKLVVDISGTHPRALDSVTINATTRDLDGTLLDLQAGRVYEIVLFQAERNKDDSNYQLTLSGFGTKRTQCVEVCGDGEVTRGEDCDDGVNNGTAYGFCTEECTRGPYCGDGVVQSPEEVCDNGVNLDIYATSAEACAPGCMAPGSCGDGTVDVAFGEECDAADQNDGAYGGCDPECKLAPRCGDKKIQADEGETCDDGNRKNGDGCNVNCQVERIPHK